MMKPICAAATAAFAICLLSASGSALAQTGGAPGGGAPGGGQSSWDGPSGPSAPEAPARQASVMMVTSVEVLRSTRPTQLDIIRVRGLTPTSGWNEPSLKPLTLGTPPDGMLDFVFVASAPAGGSEPMGFSPIAIVFPIQPGHPYKGIRVHAGINALTVAAIPGFAEAHAAAVNDCAACVGKYFVATGAGLPAGKTAGDVVKQEDLPLALRVIKPSDGISTVDSNPNRLTLVLDENGRIVDAGWD